MQLNLSGAEAHLLAPGAARPTNRSAFPSSGDPRPRQEEGEDEVEEVAGRGGWRGEEGTTHQTATNQKQPSPQKVAAASG